MKLFINKIKVMLLVVFLSTGLSSVALATGLLAYEPFHTTLAGDSVSYISSTDISNQSPPPALGFDQTAKWGAGGGTPYFEPSRISIDYINGGVLKTSAGRARLYNVKTTETVAKSRALTNNLVNADLPVVYFSALCRFETNSVLNDYWCMGLASAGISDTSGGRACMVGLLKTTDTTTAKWFLMKTGTKYQFGSDFKVNTGKEHFLVMKVELNANGNKERISVFVDPDPSLSETENAGAKLLDQHEADVFANSSAISHMGFWAWRGAIFFC